MKRWRRRLSVGGRCLLLRRLVEPLFKLLEPLGEHAHRLCRIIEGAPFARSLPLGDERLPSCGLAELSRCELLHQLLGEQLCRNQL